MKTVCNYELAKRRKHNITAGPPRRKGGRAGSLFEGGRVSYSSGSHIAGDFNDLKESRLHRRAAALEYKTRARALRYQTRPPVNMRSARDAL